MKRNDVVKPLGENGYFYGRIWRVLKDGRVVVICSGKHVKVYLPEELEVTDYKGYTSNYDGKYYPMYTLRQLKKFAAQYNPHFGSYCNAWGNRWTKEETKKALKSVGTDVWWADL